MTTFSVRFLGCKVSYSDSEEIRERLLADGHEEAAAGEAEVALVNTCCVTREALGKSRQAVAKAARTHESVYVTGCGADLEGAFSGLPENVVSCPGARPLRPSWWRACSARFVGSTSEPRPKRVRAFVTIQDGCSFGCSYCVVPLVRGPGRSKPAERGAGRGAPPRRAGAQGGRPLRDQSRLLPRRARPGSRSPGWCARRGGRPGSSACAFPRSRSITSAPS